MSFYVQNRSSEPKIDPPCQFQNFFFFFFLFNFVTSPEGPLHNTIIFTTVLEMLFTISTVTRETNAILHKIRLEFEQLAPALHT